jgi:transposase-like protein
VKGKWYYLYRAINKYDQTIDFLLTEERDEQAAPPSDSSPRRSADTGSLRRSPYDGSAANEAAIKSYNAEHGTTIEIRKIKYLHDVVEQDHRAVKRVTRPMRGFKTFEVAQCTLAGVELMHMLKKKQRLVEAGDEGLAAAEQFYALVSSPPHQAGRLTPKRLHTKICDGIVLSHPMSM